MTLQDYDKSFVKIALTSDEFTRLIGLDGDLVNFNHDIESGLITILVQMRDGSGHKLKPGQYCEPSIVVHDTAEDDLSKVTITATMIQGNLHILRTDIESKIKSAKTVIK